jgi:Zn-dependent peptidase ImmA (M78 family)
VEYFERRNDRRRPDPVARSFFRSLRSTPQRDRDRADAHAEHVLDLVDYLERQVKLPLLDIPQLTPSSGNRIEIEEIARQIRQTWQVPAGPIANVVRLLEAHGVIVARLDSGGSKLDAFSRWFAERPLVLLWADKGDKARSRFDAAHELGHLVMHSDPDPLDREQERQANMFASAFLMPSEEVGPYLPRRAPTLGSWPQLLEWRKHWGVSAKALLYRARELGALSESAFRRAMVNYNKQRLKERDGTQLGDPESPLLLVRSLEALGLPDPLNTVARNALVPRSLVDEVFCGGSFSSEPSIEAEVRAIEVGPRNSLGHSNDGF